MIRGEAEHGEGGFVSFGAVLERAVEAAGTARDIAITTESPIEAMFGIAADRIPTRQNNVTILSMFPFSRGKTPIPGDHITMIAQHWWNNYRVDWAFHSGFLTQPWVFVECDGRAFHSSDAQIMRDAKRDAEMRAAGIPVLRFSGSDIYKNADMCAIAAFWEIEALYKKQRGF